MSHFDLHMTMIFPEDISYRISSFMAGSLDFPFIRKDELYHFYIYTEEITQYFLIRQSSCSCKQTIETLEHSIEKYKNGPSPYLTQNLSVIITRRQLQITVDKNKNHNKVVSEINDKAIINDPVILSECFSQHVSFYNQKYSFFFYGPLKDNELIHDLRSLLSGRIVMLGYNKEQDELPFEHPIIPLYVWARENLLKRS